MIMSFTYGFGHANTSIADAEGLVGFVWDDVNPKIFPSVELARIRKSLISNLVESIRTVGDQFSEKDLFVRVDGIDDEGEELRNLSLKLESFSRHDCGIVLRVLEKEKLPEKVCQFLW